MKLRVVEFSADYLQRVQCFECGPNDWCRLAESWIKNAPPFPGALQSMLQRNNAVWLYFIDAADEEYLVGFSSLGTTKWRIPPPDGPRREAGFIPMLAVALRFQGKPDGDPGKRYVDDMIEHVVQESRKRGHRELCLFVHENNARAISVYSRHGFQTLGERDDRGLLRMLRLLD